MIRAIVFDCFGVLTEDAWLAFNTKYQGTDTYKKAHELNDKSDLGLITDKVLYTGLAELLGKTPEQVERIFTSEQKHIELFDYIKKELKPKYRIGMLSNVNRGFMEAFLTGDEKSLFDGMVLSGEIGIAKPDIRAYQTVCQKLGVETSEAIMIDDREYNVDGAIDSGMKAILYKDFDQLKFELEKLLANPDN